MVDAVPEEDSERRDEEDSGDDGRWAMLFLKRIQRVERRKITGTMVDGRCCS